MQVSEASIRVWLNDPEEKARRFPNAVKFGRDWQIPASDVDKLPAGRKPGRPAKPSTSAPEKPATAKAKRGNGAAANKPAKKRGRKAA
jgi:hypothetical protein